MEKFGTEGAAPRVASGAELRRRLITPETLAAIAEERPKRSFLERIFGSK